MRTKQCRLIARRECIAVEPILLDFDAYTIALGEDPVIEGWRCHVFAKFDGFSGFDEMAAFWKMPSGGGREPLRRFAGLHIRWLPLPADLGGN